MKKQPGTQSGSHGANGPTESFARNVGPVDAWQIGYGYENRSPYPYLIAGLHTIGLLSLLFFSKSLCLGANISNDQVTYTQPILKYSCK